MNIDALKNKEKGKTIYVVANGPSILTQDLSFLDNEVVIGMNGLPFVEGRCGFKSDYYVVSDKRFLEESHKFECATKLISESCIRVFRRELKDIDDDRLSKRTFYIKSLGRDGFSHDLKRGFYFGCTTTMLAVQLASYLGAGKIVIIGCDLNYPKSQPRVYKETTPSPIDNFTGIQIQNLRNSYLELRVRGVELHNASPISMLKPYLPMHYLN